MGQKWGCGTLVGWGTLVGGIATLITALAVFWNPKDTVVNQPNRSSPAPTVVQPDPGQGKSDAPPSVSSPSSEELDANTVVVDPFAITQQIINTPLAARDFYAGKKILLRYDIKVDASTIRSCTSSERCITGTIIQRNEGTDRSLTITCSFPESYTPYLQGLNRELFSSRSTYLLTLSGYLGSTNEIMSYYHPIYLTNCQVINVNRSS